MINNKKNKDDLIKIFALKQKRINFINEYNFFDSDENFLFYKSFILDRYRTDQTEILIELMELSIKINYYNVHLFNHLRDLFKRKKFWYRLTFLDYTFSMRMKIGKKLYKSVNETALKQTSNFEIRFQACINLYAVNVSYEEELIHLISLANKKVNHYALYRVAGLLNGPIEIKGIEIIREQFRKMLETNNSQLPISQRDEILSLI